MHILWSPLVGQMERRQFRLLKLLALQLVLVLLGFGKYMLLTMGVFVFTVSEFINWPGFFSCL